MADGAAARPRESVTGRACARVGLMGNPGDALGGPAIALAISDLGAEVTVEPCDRLRLVEPQDDRPEWEGLEDLFTHIRHRGYHGGRRLMMALIRRLARHPAMEGNVWPLPNFALTWRTSIPLCVGLGGSSALLAAAMRAICDFWGLALKPEEAVKTLLRVEVKDLGIPAGPMDRVAQVHEGLTHLWVDEAERLHVESLDPQALPPLFVAVDEGAAEGTEVFHSSLRERHLGGDPETAQVATRLAALTREAVDLLRSGRGEAIGPLMDENFDVRRRLTRLNPRHEAMIRCARAAGAHAKFAGSGGAIVGTCDEARMEAVMDALRADGMMVFRPTAAPSRFSAGDSE